MKKTCPAVQICFPKQLQFKQIADIEKLDNRNSKAENEEKKHGLFTTQSRQEICLEL